MGMGIDKICNTMKSFNFINALKWTVIGIILYHLLVEIMKFSHYIYDYVSILSI
jgi:hypothetical protein